MLRTLRPVLIVLVACLLAGGLLAGSAHAAKGSFTKCGWISFEQDPTVPNDHGGVVYARGWICRKARREVRRWVTSGRTAEQLGWACRSRRVVRDSGPAVNWNTCTRGGRAIKIKIWEM